MRRRTALTVTGAVALTLAAGSAAMAANLGILDRRNRVDIHDLSPVDPAPVTAPAATAPVLATPDGPVAVPALPGDGTGATAAPAPDAAPTTVDEGARHNSDHNSAGNADQSAEHGRDGEGNHGGNPHSDAPDEQRADGADEQGNDQGRGQTHDRVGRDEHNDHSDRGGQGSDDDD